MAQNGDVNLTTAWTELTDTAVASVVVQNKGPNIIILMGTNGPGAPGPGSEEGIELDKRIGVLNLDLQTLFPGVGTPNRLYARTRGGEATVFRSHA